MSKYICSVCGSEMEFEDEWEDSLVCPNCGSSTDVDHYGLTDEEYDAQFPSMKEVLGYDFDNDDDDGESYDEVFGEPDD